ncbi:MAG: hypothetical protein H0T72_05960 [Chloroflexia bacterium]|nr:hypothetical protein [Chloroflexia bacterium]
MNTNIKRGIVTGAISLSLLGGTAAVVAAAPVQGGGSDTVMTAQSEQRTNVGQLVSGLINVNVGAVAVNVGDITVEDLVDVNDVLNDNNVEILNNVLNNSPILSNNSDILTDLLRDADILNDTQVVVGVLSGGIFVIQ